MLNLFYKNKASELILAFFFFNKYTSKNIKLKFKYYNFQVNILTIKLYLFKLYLGCFFFAKKKKNIYF